MAREYSTHLGSGTLPFNGGLKEFDAGLTGERTNQYPLPSSGLAHRYGVGTVVLNPEDFSAHLGLKSNNISITTTAAALPVTAFENRRAIAIYNFGAGTLFIGASDITITNGFPILAGSSISIDIQGSNNVTIFAVSDSTADVRILEIA